MQYCSLQHQTLLSPSDISTTECCFCFGPAASFCLELLVNAIHSSPVAYWTPSDLGGLIFQCHIFLPFHTAHGVLMARILECPLYHRGLEYKRRKSRDTWSYRQVWPWSTKWNREKANRVMSREHTGHSKHPLSNNTRDGSTHGHHQMVNIEIRMIIFFVAKDGEALYSQ